MAPPDPAADPGRLLRCLRLRRGPGVALRVVRPHLLLFLALLMLTIEAFGLAAQFDRDLASFIVAALLQGAVWTVAAFVVTRGSDGGRAAFGVILATAVLLR